MSEKPTIGLFGFKPVLPPAGAAPAFIEAYRRGADDVLGQVSDVLRKWNDYLVGFDETRITDAEGRSMIVMAKARQTGTAAAGGAFQVVSRFSNGAWRPGVRYGTVFDDFGDGPVPELDGVGPLTLPLSSPAYFPGGISGQEFLWMKVEFDDADAYKGELTAATIHRGYGPTAPDSGGVDYFWVRVGWADDAGNTHSDLSGNMRSHRRGGPGAPYTIYPT